MCSDFHLRSDVLISDPAFLRDISCQELQNYQVLKHFYAEQIASLQITPFLKYQLADWVCRNDILLLRSYSLASVLCARWGSCDGITLADL